MAGRIAARGEVAYLHAYDSNAAAIGLYESIGFRLRNRMNMAMLQRAK
ncbi:MULTISPECIES: GNAT family N-acetyltransferase [unclassified Mesorhizobium]|nr:MULTISPECIES: GNAT family N-acetyltransferase [unclassified Mesorhizobium]